MNNKEILERWERSGMLRHLANDRKMTMAVLLESQRLADEDHKNCQWKRMTIPLIYRVFHDNFSVCGTLEAQDRGCIFTGFLFNEQTFKQNPHSQYSIDIEAEVIAQISKKMREQVDQVVEKWGQIKVHCIELYGGGQVAMNYGFDTEEIDYFKAAF